MTIGLTFDDVLSRVQVAISDRPDGTVLVERAATVGFQIPTTVRGGVALPISGGLGNLDDFEFFADVENHYRISPVDPPPGLLLDGTAGSYASTPDAAALDITTDAVLTASIKPAAWPPATQQSLVSKYRTGDNQRSYRLFLRDTGLLAFAWSEDGTNATTTNVNSTVAPEPDPDTGELHVRAWLDVDFGGINHRVLFWTAPTADGPWATLGNTVADVGTTSVHAGTAPLEIGSVNEGTAELFDGTVLSATVFDGNISGGEHGTGTLVADPDFAQPHGTTSFTDDAGRPWTVNGTAEINGTETASITPSLAGRVWLKSIRYPALNTVVTVSDYGDIEAESRSATFPIAGRSLPTGVGELHGGRDHLLDLKVDNDADSTHLDLMTRLGGEFLIHVPVDPASGLDGNTLLPGSMYVLIGRLRRHRIGGVSAHQLYSLPLAEINPPGPDVVGTTVLWSTIQRVYGSWEAVWAAHSTWRSVWDTIGSPDDLYVP